MKHDDIALLIDAYEAAMRLRHNLSDHAGLRPMAETVVDSLGDFITSLLDTSAIGDNQHITYYPIVTRDYSDRTWSTPPVTCNDHTTVDWRAE